MREGLMGSSRHPPEKAQPPDAELLWESTGWKVHTSRSTGEVIIDTKSYHPGLLYLSRSDLEEMLRQL